MLRLKIRNQTRNTQLADAADIADTSRKRRIGLLKHNSLPEGQGLWILPCEGVHSFGMKFPIDVLFMDRTHKVLKARSDMVPRRIALSLWAHSVLELPKGTIDRTQTRAGDQLEIEKYEVQESAEAD